MPYKDPAVHRANARRHYWENREHRLAMVKAYKAANLEKAREWNRNWAREWRRKHARRGAKAVAAALVAKAAEIAKQALADRARGYSGKINPGRI